jgi:hypothetical protein
MALVSVREYARRRGINEAAVRKRLVSRGGPIPTHGRAKCIDSDQADALWFRTMSPSGASTSRFQGPPGAAAPDDATRAAPRPPLPAATFGKLEALTQARTAVLLAEAGLKRLRLEERRGQLLDRQATLGKLFAAVRGLRDAWLSSPARIGPELAADLGVDATRVMIALDPLVRRQLDELAAGVRLDRGDGRRSV